MRCLGWKGGKPALVWAGGGCWSGSRDVPITVGTSLKARSAAAAATRALPLVPLSSLGGADSFPLASPLGKPPCLQHVGLERRHQEAPGWWCSGQHQPSTARVGAAGTATATGVGQGWCSSSSPWYGWHWRVLSKASSALETYCLHQDTQAPSHLCFGSAAPALRGSWRVRSSQAWRRVITQELRFWFKTKRLSGCHGGCGRIESAAWHLESQRASELPDELKIDTALS